MAEAARRGKRWAAEPSPKRLRLLAARLREHPDDPPSIAVDVIRGALAYWGPAKPDFEPLRHLIPDTLYRLNKFDVYLEAARAPASETGRDKRWADMTREEKDAAAAAAGMA